MLQRVDVRIVLALALIALGFALGNLGHGGKAPASGDENGTGVAPTDSAKETPQPTIWTCSMHPQIQLPKPGKCPICGMDLIPQSSLASETGAARLTMSEDAMKLAEVQTTEVVRQHPHVEVRMVGKVDYDETRQRQISAWVGGRIDRMYVDSTGIPIRKGDHLASIYSPELVSAQEELLQAIQARKALSGSGVGVLRDTAEKTVTAAREKLRLLGLTAQQVEKLEQSQKVEDHITIYTPTDGVVISKRAVEGDYVKTGAAIYEIADLNSLWVKMDAYESDLVWLRYGQKVSFRAEAYPGQVVTGTISFIDPVLNPRTRTAKVRVNVENERGLLKPGMFVHAVVAAEVASGGRVIDESLKGKWIGPMHPEIVRDHPGKCPVCGMDLVPAEELGYVTSEAPDEAPLVIPASAPLLTGKRAVVYVQVPDTERPTFEGREVVLGPRAGDVYLVDSGLHEGEMVVTHGAFKIDSAMQISAKPSMMSPPSEPPASGQDHSDTKVPAETTEAAPAASFQAPAAFREQFDRVVVDFLALTDELAHDDLHAARASAKSLESHLGAVDMELLEGQAHMEWMGLLRDLKPAAKAASEATDLEGLRAQVPALNGVIAAGLGSFGMDDVGDVREFHCPMAFDGKGANWLQRGKKTLNPYYGNSMQTCGNEVRVLSRAKGEGR